MPAVLVVLVAVDNEVTDETLNRLHGTSILLRLLYRFGSWRWGFVTTNSDATRASFISAPAASFVRLPFSGITLRPGVFAIVAAGRLGTILIGVPFAGVTPVQLVVLQIADLVLASATRLMGSRLLGVPLGPRPTANAAAFLAMSAILVSDFIALITPVKLIVLVVTDDVLASAGRVLRVPPGAVILGPGPTADTAVGALATILISDFIALVAPTELMWFEFKDVVLAATEGILGFPLSTVPLGPRPTADTAFRVLSAFLVSNPSALVTPMKIMSREGVRGCLAAALGVR